MDRSEARAAAMKLVYEREMGGEGGEETVSGMLNIVPGEAEFDYAQKICDGVALRLAEIDSVIERHLQNWSMERISRVDLAILRVGVYEMLTKSAPVFAVKSEAVRLANEFSTDKSGAFVNGVLGAIEREEARA